MHGSASQYYNQILEQVQLEEELGFDSVWFGEHHYSGYSFGSPPVIAMAAAARTKRIRLGKVFSGITYDDINQKNLILIGDAENLVVRIKWAQEFYGTNYLILEVAQGGMPHKHVMPSLERFAKYVMPHFR